MLKVILAAVSAFLLLASSSEALSCRRCHLVHCQPLEGDCEYGVGSDVCGCCDVCKQGPGERCGGPFDDMGVCGTGLTCDLDLSRLRDPTDTFNADGTCIHQEEARQKRGLANGRRAGHSRVQASTHSHQVYGGIPEHIKEQLRARGIVI